MNWTEAAKKQLGMLEGLRLAVENIPCQIKVLEREGAEAESIRALKKSLDRARRQVSSIDSALSALSPEEKLVLYRLYIFPQRGKLELLCQELGMEESSIYRRRDRGMEKFVLALYGENIRS